MLESRAAHGGDVERLSRLFGVPVDAWLDFSANVNPLGPPATVLAYLKAYVASPGSLERYPDADAHELRAAIAARDEIGAASIVVANGAAAAIDAVVTALQPASALVIVPAFSEYDRALRARRVNVVTLSLDPGDDFRLDVDRCLELVAQLRPGLVILTNPHNPSGALTPADGILRIGAALRAYGATLLVDEAFIDYALAESVCAAAATNDAIICVRSLTKLFAMPALRVGYAVATPPLATRIAFALPSWPVSACSAGAAVCALADREYVERMMATFARDREQLASGLRELGFAVTPSSANFILARIPALCGSSTALREWLIENHRILIRDCVTYEGLDARYVRVAVRSEQENRRLLLALRLAV